MRRMVTLALAATVLALPALAADKPQPAKQLVTLEFYDLQLAHLLDLIAKTYGASCVVVPPELAKRPITITTGEPTDMQGVLAALRAAGIDHTLVGDTYVFYARPGAAEVAPTPVVTPPPAKGESRVTLDLRDASLEEALRAVFRQTSYSYALGPGSVEDRRVTLALNDVPFSVALQAIAQAANVDMVRERGNSGIYSVVPRPTVSMGGAQVPVVGAMTLGPGGSAAGTGVSAWPGPSLGPVDAASLFAQFARTGTGIVPPAGPGEKLVDLDVKDVPIREAMARLAQASGLEIVVNAAVSPQIRVTARAFAVPADWLLDTIVSQAHLTVVRQALPEQPASSPEAAAQQLLLPRYRYHVVPPPEVRVTGVPAPEAAPATSPR